MAILNFDYHRAIRQANQISNYADQLRNLASQDMKRSIESISAAWQGEAATQFIGHCTRTQTAVSNQASKLQDLAERIREVARIIHEAEERAKELERQRAASAASQGYRSSRGPAHSTPRRRK
ncbi:MAG: WXG100 family type VII secretion target [Bacillota bacterium]|nr:WXG100 family type VII secretion target [Bacillota bacterium]